MLVGQLIEQGFDLGVGRLVDRVLGDEVVGRFADERGNAPPEDGGELFVGDAALAADRCWVEALDGLGDHVARGESVPFGSGNAGHQRGPLRVAQDATREFVTEAGCEGVDPGRAETVVAVTTDSGGQGGSQAVPQGAGGVFVGEGTPGQGCGK